MPLDIGCLQFYIYMLYIFIHSFNIDIKGTYESTLKPLPDSRSEVQWEFRHSTSVTLMLSLHGVYQLMSPFEAISTLGLSKPLLGYKLTH